jgi:ABC-type Fe3+-hydroxamate transport system substrate-binding protein
MWIGNLRPTKTPARIISVVPSQTELLAYFGLDQQVVGITKFCIHPAHWTSTKKIIGGTKNLNIPAIIDLQPDLIIANKEENIKEQIESLANQFPVWLTDVSNISQALTMIDDIAQLFDKQETSKALQNLIVDALQQIQQATIPPLNVLYLIWKDPYMTIGGDTYINDMLRVMNLNNVFADKLRYPSINLQDIEQANPDLIFLSSEPYPFKEKHIEELKKSFPSKKIMIVDGEMFSWFGSRLQLAIPYFIELSKDLYHKAP